MDKERVHYKISHCFTLRTNRRFNAFSVIAASLLLALFQSAYFALAKQVQSFALFVHSNEKAKQIKHFVLTKLRRLFYFIQ